MRYYIISGEASGDLHGSNLIRELKLCDPMADIRCWGGDKMQAAGGTLVKHYRDLAFMGFVEVIKNLRTIFRNLAFCREDIVQYQPDVLILIDYPGFNLRIATWAKQQGLKVVYYISPQVWAWKEGRVKQVKANVDLMLVILPFEKAFYQKWNYPVQYVGHPLVKVIDDFKLQDAPLIPAGWISDQPLVALLPGSRKQEILKKLPIMLEVAGGFTDFHFVVAKAPGLEDAFYEQLLAPYQNVSAVSNQTYPLLSKAKAAMVTSGTATLETALFGVPEVICYKGSPVSYAIAKRLIKIKYICLVNLILDKEVVKELIQDELTVENLTQALRPLLYDASAQQAMALEYAALHRLLSEGGDASANAARAISHWLITGEKTV